MKQAVRAILPYRFILASLALSLPAGAQASDMPSYIGATYSGSVRAEIDDSTLAITKRRYGSATVEFTRLSPGKARLVVFGTIRKEGDAGFAIDGSYNRSGFRGSGSGISLTIDAADKISGGGTNKDQEYSFSGTISRADLDLSVRNRPTAQAAASTIRGIGFAYDLSREGERKSGASGKTCRAIRYEMRPLANIGEGTMSMLRVPICLK